MSAPLLELDSVSFAYKGAPETVHGVSLLVEPGECVVLCGPSGGGKTTIVRLVNGLAGGYYPGDTSGSLSFSGRAGTELASWARAELVGSVFQDPAAQFFSSELEGEVAFTCENLGYDHARVVECADAAIRALHLDGLRGCSNDRLSSGQKQKVAIASAMALRPALLAMDEPSSNLDEEASLELGRTLLQLKREGFALLIAEHRISYLMDVADRFCLVREGRIERALERAEVLALDEGERRAWGLRSFVPVARLSLPAPSIPSASARPVRPRVRSRRSASVPGADGALKGCSQQHVVLDVADATVSFGAHRVFDNVSFSVEAGQIVALTGVNGAGKTTLLRAVAGLLKLSGGFIAVDGARRNPRELRRLVWYSPNDVRAEFFTPSVEEEVALLLPQTDEVRGRAERVLGELDLLELRDRYPLALSGGQRQRLSIACGLVARRSALVLDEPTSGLDSANMERLSRALRFAASEGQAVLVATHDNEFMRACCTHDYVLGKASTLDASRRSR